MSADTEEPAAVLELRPGNELTIITRGKTSGELDSVIFHADGSSGPQRKGHPHRLHGLLRGVAESGFKTDLIRIRVRPGVWREGVAARDFKPGVRPRAVFHHGIGLRNALKTRGAIELGILDEGQDGIGAEGVENEWAVAAELVGID